MDSKHDYQPVESLTSGPEHHFIGFNDICPWDSKGRCVLATQSHFTDHIPEADDRAMIGMVDLERDKRFVPLAETRAWNFQQGARAQWVPGLDRCLIYNDRQEGRFVSAIVDVESRERRVLPLPVFALSPDGRSALTVNFSRLHRLYFSYGYAGVSDPGEGIAVPQDDGIFAMDIATGEYDLILSIAQVVRFGGLPEEARKREHWLTHILFNPSGTRFCFLHRWRLEDGGHYTRLLSANLDGTGLRCVAEGMVSHFTWRNDRQILAWARQRSLVSKASQSHLFAPLIRRRLRPITRKLRRGWFRQHVIGDCYTLFTDGKTQQTEVVGVGTLNEDGHMSYSPDGEWTLTDTYPDDESRQTLILYHWKDGRRIDIGEFFTPPEIVAKGYRCDLHPRWNRAGNKVCVDSAHDGSRQIYVVDVSDVTRRMGGATR